MPYQRLDNEMLAAAAGMLRRMADLLEQNPEEVSSVNWTVDTTTSLVGRVPFEREFHAIVRTHPKNPKVAYVEPSEVASRKDMMMVGDLGPMTWWKCRKPDCLRKVKPGTAYCCGPCDLAAQGKYEIHEHSQVCEGNTKERGEIEVFDVPFFKTAE